MAFASVIAVVLTMAAALTLLPAMLGFLGTRVLSRRERRRLAGERAPGRPRQRLLGALGGVRVPPARHPGAGRRRADGRPGQPGPVASAGALRRRQRPRRHAPRGKAYDLLAPGFGAGFNGPLLLVAQGGSAADRAALAGLTQTPAVRARRRRGRALPVRSREQRWRSCRSSRRPPRRTLAPATLIQHLRKDVIPAAEQGHDAARSMSAARRRSSPTSPPSSPPSSRCSSPSSSASASCCCWSPSAACSSRRPPRS